MGSGADGSDGEPERDADGADDDRYRELRVHGAGWGQLHGDGEPDELHVQSAERGVANLVSNGTANFTGTLMNLSISGE